MSNVESKFNIGDVVTITKDTPMEDLVYIGAANITKGTEFVVAGLDACLWEKYNVFGVRTECGYHLPDCILTKVCSAPTAQQKLDKLKKYFESGNDVPVQQATIKAKDFWAIYNS